MRLELHCHSKYSRGKKIPVEGLDSPADLVKAAKAKGLEGIALTDHSTHRGWNEAKEEAKRQGMLFIPAIEISSLDGHVIGLGLSDYVKSGLPLDETLDAIRSQGGVSIAVHPFDIRGEGLGAESGKADVIEAFNSMNLDKFSNRLARAFAKKNGKPCVAGSDAHTKEMIGQCVNLVQAHDLDSALSQIRRGSKFQAGYIPLGKLLPWVKQRMALSHNDILDYMERNYSQPRRWFSERMLCKFISNERAYWYWLGEAGLAGSRAYGMMKALNYPL